MQYEDAMHGAVDLFYVGIHTTAQRMTRTSSPVVMLAPRTPKQVGCLSGSAATTYLSRCMSSVLAAHARLQI
jgi:hypothetical protein